MHIAGPEQWVNQMCDGLVCPGVPVMSRRHWFSRIPTLVLKDVSIISSTFIITVRG